MQLPFSSLLMLPVGSLFCLLFKKFILLPNSMALRSAGRKLSFDLLRLPDALNDDASTRPVLQNPKKKRKKKFKKPTLHQEHSIASRNGDILVRENSSEIEIRVEEYKTCPAQGELDGKGSAFPVSTVAVSLTPSPQLRQRNVNFLVASGGSEIEVGNLEDSSASAAASVGFEECKQNESLKQEAGVQYQQPLLLPERKVEMNGRRLEKDESLDWRKLMPEDPHYAYPVEKSPWGYFLEEIRAGHSLRNTISLGNDKERERVYDTIFSLPWRIELLINVGYFVCMDSFLSLLTVMPTRVVMVVWRFLKTRQFSKLSAAELSDFGCFIVLVSGVTLLQLADISLIYHMIRGQGTIKLYVVYNVLEIFDKLCQNFGGDVLQTLFRSAEGLASCSPESLQYWLWRFSFDEGLAMGSSIVHSFILLAQGITLSTCIVAHNNALFALLVSNNFAEIKSNVFKRFSKDNVHNLVYFDSVERFHISAFLLFVLAQNILEAEGSWLRNFAFNASVVYVCEVMIDVIKHSFIAKFNDIKPNAFSDFLEDLCKQILKIQADNGKQRLTFVPLAPACVVIRVLRPVYMAHLPLGPLPWRLFWIILLSVMTFVMLTSLKLLIGMGLQKYARWYIKRCEKRKLHTD